MFAAIAPRRSSAQYGIDKKGVFVLGSMDDAAAKKFWDGALHVLWASVVRHAEGGIHRRRARSTARMYQASLPWPRRVDNLSSRRLSAGVSCHPAPVAMG